MRLAGSRAISAALIPGGVPRWCIAAAMAGSSASSCSPSLVASSFIAPGLREAYSQNSALSAANSALAAAAAVVAVAGCGSEAGKPDAYGVGHKTVTTPRPATSTSFNCFYVYGTVSEESSVNANLKRGKAEIYSAMAQAAPFSPVCKIYAPIYRQVTLADLEAHPDLNFGGAETVFPSLGSASTPWVAYPGRYTARCQQGDGVSWLNVTKAHRTRRPPPPHHGGRRSAVRLPRR